MNTDFQVIPATTDTQLHQISALAETIWHEYFAAILEKEQIVYMLDKFQSFPALKEQTANGYEYYQLWNKEEFCGYCGIHPGTDHRLFLSKLYLKKEARGQHLASKAFDFLKNYCHEQDLNAIWLTCNKHNDNSLGVYRHFGFQTIDTQEADIGNGFIMDDYIMEYRL